MMKIGSLAIARALAAVLMLSAIPLWASAAPAFVCVTPTHRIEVEAVSGSDQYDYRSWRLNKPGDGPALTLRGSMEVQGTGACRTRYWTFKNGKYEYVIADSANCGEEMPPAGATGQLTVSLSGKEISQSWCLGELNGQAMAVGATQDNARKGQEVAPRPSEEVGTAAVQVSTGSSPTDAASSALPVQPPAVEAIAPATQGSSQVPAHAKAPLQEVPPKPRASTLSTILVLVGVLLPIPIAWIAFKHLRSRKGTTLAAAVSLGAAALTFIAFMFSADVTETPEHKAWISAEVDRKSRERAKEEALQAERTEQPVENCSAAFREQVNGKWLCRKLTLEEAKFEADIAEASKKRPAREREEGERLAVNIKDMERAAQAMMDIERKYPWSSRISGLMAEGSTGNHCMSVLRAVAAYEKNGLSVPPDLILAARNARCL